MNIDELLLQKEKKPFITVVCLFRKEIHTLNSSMFNNRRLVMEVFSDVLR
jgi:hypothetical protein